jgi:3-dehydroquinate synthase
LAQVMVRVPGGDYPVVVGEGAIHELPGLVRDLAPTGVAMVTDRTVGSLWAEPVLAGLQEIGLECPVYEVEPGEPAKTLAVLEEVLTFLEDVRLDRRGLVIALGGGTVGDLAGFASAVWLRGVRCLQIPTTLLAMVDSSIGGKTGINTARAKNAVGSFWQPVGVVSDLAMLATLPEGELTSAFGEVIKYGLSLDAKLVDTLRAERQLLQARDPEVLEPVVIRCVELKAGVVGADEREQGRRAILNYGHTTGHAIEGASGYRAMHGRAVAQGMRVAARLGVELGLCDHRVLEVHEELLGAYALPGPLPAVRPEAVLAVLPRDKKANGGQIGWVIPREVGRAQVDVRVPQETVARVLREVLEA